jgi:hypothetical protein
VGIGTGNPQYPLDFGSLIQNRTLALFNNGAFYGFGISAGKLRLEVPANASHSFGFFNGSSEVFRIGQQDFQAGLGVSKLGLGSAYSSGLNWGTAYLGFNAIRSGSSWVLDTDGANNGASAIWGTVGGAIHFAAVPNAGTGARTLTDAQMLASTRLLILNDGKVRIGDVSTASNDYLLFVKKGIATAAVFVNSSYADYVFAPGYALPSFGELRAHIAARGHLPGMPSQAEIDAEGGFELVQITVKQMEKIEELYLYVLQLEERIRELEAQQD